MSDHNALILLAPASSMTGGISLAFV